MREFVNFKELKNQSSKRLKLKVPELLRPLFLTLVMGLTALSANTANAASVNNTTINSISSGGNFCFVNFSLTASFDTDDQNGDDRYIVGVTNSALDFVFGFNPAFPGVDVASSPNPFSTTLLLQPFPSNLIPGPYFLTVIDDDLDPATTDPVIAQIPIPTADLLAAGGACVNMTVPTTTNTAPVADAGPDQLELRPNDTVTLDGSGSSDADGDTLTYTWTQNSGPTVSLEDASAVNPTFTAPLDAVDTPIVFELVVNDGTSDSPADSVTISAVNTAPVADAGVDQDNLIPGSIATLNGTASSDADGDTLTYAWTQVSGPVAVLSDNASAMPTFTAPPSSVPLVFELVVSDGFVDSAPDTVSVTVQDNVAITSKAIGDFLTARNALILSHQPDLQRRIDRLAERTAGGGSASLSGFNLPGSNKLPLRLAMDAGAIEMSSSLSAMRKDGKSGRFDIWAEAYISDFTIDNKDGGFDIYYVGADYMVSEKTLVGVLGQVDKVDYDNSVTTGVLNGNGWMLGPYVTTKLSENLYLDARASYGQSDNKVSPFGTYNDNFETVRYLFAGTLTGEYQLSKRLMLRPEAGFNHLTENQDSYTDSLGSTIPDQTVKQGQIHASPRLHLDLDIDTEWNVRPFVEARGIMSFGDNVDVILGSKNRLRFESGVDLFSKGGLRASASYYQDGIGADKFETEGWRLSIGFTPTGH